MSWPWHMFVMAWLYAHPIAPAGIPPVVVPGWSILVQCRSEYDTNFDPIPELAHLALREAVHKDSTMVLKVLAVQ